MMRAVQVRYLMITLERALLQLKASKLSEISLISLMRTSLISAIRYATYDHSESAIVVFQRRQIGLTSPLLSVICLSTL